MSGRTTRMLLSLCLFALSVKVMAWSDHFRLINNTSTPLHFQFFPDHHSGAHPGQGDVPAYTDGEDVSITDGDWWSSDGDVQVSQGDVQCRYHYHGVANDHELTKLAYVSGPAICQQASLLRDNSEKDCNGEHNCIIANPDLTWASKALVLQTEMGADLPLSQRQLMGTHNSAVSKHYIQNGIDDWVALNQSLTLSEQLNLGVRSLELDVVYSNKALRICHFHTDKNPDLLCFNNKPVQNALSEIKQWMLDHKDQFVMVYLDVNHALNAEQVHVMDQQLQQTFGDRLYTVADAYQLPMGDESAQYNKPLPMSEISVRDLLSRGKQVVVSAHKDFDNSAQVFMHALNDGGIERYVEDQADCSKRNQDMFADPMHKTIWRLNGDRSLASAIIKASDYVTVDEIHQFQACGINMYSVDKLTQRDARVAALIWSWQQYYPIDAAQEGSEPYAVINPALKRFNNQTPISAVGQVLCRSPENKNWTLLPWSGQSLSDKDTVAIEHLAMSICQSAGMQFAVPQTSAEMSGIHLNEQQPVLVNLFNKQSHWLSVENS